MIQFNFWKHCPRQIWLLPRPCCQDKGAWRKGQACSSKELLQGSVAIQTMSGHIWQEIQTNILMWEVLSNQQITGIIIRECLRQQWCWQPCFSRGELSGCNWQQKWKKYGLMGEGRGGIKTSAVGENLLWSWRNSIWVGKPRQRFLNWTGVNALLWTERQKVERVCKLVWEIQAICVGLPFLTGVHGTEPWRLWMAAKFPSSEEQD